MPLLDVDLSFFEQAVRELHGQETTSYLTRQGGSQNKRWGFLKIPRSTLNHNRALYYIYSLSNPIGSGSFGNIYKARTVSGINPYTDEFDPEQLKSEIQSAFDLKPSMVVKSYKKTSYKDALDTATLEATHLSRFYYKMEPPVFTIDKETHTTRAFLASEFIPGTNLYFSTPVPQLKDLPFHRRLDLITKLVMQVVLIHRKGHMVHSDLKSDNVIVNFETDDISPLDFGLSKDMPSADPLNPDLLILADVKGHPSFFPPETLFREYGLKTDLYMAVNPLLRLLGIPNPSLTKLRTEDLDGEVFKSQIPYDTTGIIDSAPAEIEGINIKELLLSFINRMQDNDYANRPTSEEVLAFFNTLYTLNLLHQYLLLTATERPESAIMGELKRRTRKEGDPDTPYPIRSDDDLSEEIRATLAKLIIIKQGLNHIKGKFSYKLRNNRGEELPPEILIKPFHSYDYANPELCRIIINSYKITPPPEDTSTTATPEYTLKALCEADLVELDELPYDELLQLFILNETTSSAIKALLLHDKTSDHLKELNLATKISILVSLLKNETHLTSETRTETGSIPAKLSQNEIDSIITKVCDAINDNLDFKTLTALKKVEIIIQLLPFHEATEDFIDKIIKSFSSSESEDKPSFHYALEQVVFILENIHNFKFECKQGEDESKLLEYKVFFIHKFYTRYKEVLIEKHYALPPMGLFQQLIAVKKLQRIGHVALLNPQEQNELISTITHFINIYNRYSPQDPAHISLRKSIELLQLVTENRDLFSLEEFSFFLTTLYKIALSSQLSKHYPDNINLLISLASQKDGLLAAGISSEQYQEICKKAFSLNTTSETTVYTVPITEDLELLIKLIQNKDLLIRNSITTDQYNALCEDTESVIITKLKNLTSRFFFLEPLEKCSLLVLLTKNKDYFIEGEGTSQVNKFKSLFDKIYDGLTDKNLHKGFDLFFTLVKNKALILREYQLSEEIFNSLADEFFTKINAADDLNENNEHEQLFFLINLIKYKAYLELEKFTPLCEKLTNLFSTIELHKSFIGNTNLLLYLLENLSLFHGNQLDENFQTFFTKIYNQLTAFDSVAALHTGDEALDRTDLALYYKDFAQALKKLIENKSLFDTRQENFYTLCRKITTLLNELHPEIISIEENLDLLFFLLNEKIALQGNPELSALLNTCLNNIIDSITFNRLSLLNPKQRLDIYFTLTKEKTLFPDQDKYDSFYQAVLNSLLSSTCSENLNLLIYLNKERHTITSKYGINPGQYSDLYALIFKYINISINFEDMEINKPSMADFQIKSFNEAFNLLITYSSNLTYLVAIPDLNPIDIPTESEKDSCYSEEEYSDYCHTLFVSLLNTFSVNDNFKVNLNHLLILLKHKSVLTISDKKDSKGKPLFSKIKSLTTRRYEALFNKIMLALQAADLDKISLKESLYLLQNLAKNSALFISDEEKSLAQTTLRYTIKQSKYFTRLTTNIHASLVNIDLDKISSKEIIETLTFLKMNGGLFLKSGSMTQEMFNALQLKFTSKLTDNMENNTYTKNFALFCHFLKHSKYFLSKKELSDADYFSMFNLLGQHLKNESRLPVSERLALLHVFSENYSVLLAANFRKVYINQRWNDHVFLPADITFRGDPSPYLKALYNLISEKRLLTRKEKDLFTHEEYYPVLTEEQYTSLISKFEGFFDTFELEECTLEQKFRCLIQLDGINSLPSDILQAKRASLTQTLLASLINLKSIIALAKLRNSLEASEITKFDMLYMSIIQSFLSQISTKPREDKVKFLGFLLENHDYFKTILDIAGFNTAIRNTLNEVVTISQDQASAESTPTQPLLLALSSKSYISLFLKGLPAELPYMAKKLVNHVAQEPFSTDLLFNLLALSKNFGASTQSNLFKLLITTLDTEKKLFETWKTLIKERHRIILLIGEDVYGSFLTVDSFLKRTLLNSLFLEKAGSGEGAAQISSEAPTSSLVNKIVIEGTIKAAIESTIEYLMDKIFLEDDQYTGKFFGAFGYTTGEKKDAAIAFVETAEACLKWLDDSETATLKSDFTSKLSKIMNNKSIKGALSQGELGRIVSGSFAVFNNYNAREENLEKSALFGDDGEESRLIH